LAIMRLDDSLLPSTEAGGTSIREGSIRHVKRSPLRNRSFNSDRIEG
jgi:hypothetical protein